MTATSERFVVCLSNEGYPASLEVRKLYVALPDDAAERAGMLRVVDESGEDYLYPASYFASLEVPANRLARSSPVADQRLRARSASRDRRAITSPARRAIAG